MIMRAGTIAYWVVTDHPKFPKALFEGDDMHSAWRSREDAQRIADAWNASGGEWKWYVREVTIRPRARAVEQDGQLPLMDASV